MIFIHYNGLYILLEYPEKKIDVELNIIAKSKFWFGDVNGCIIFKI
jgi:hypothetical protein